MRQRNTEIQKILIEESDKIVLLPQDAICNIMRVELRDSNVVWSACISGREGGIRIVFSDGTNPSDDLRPRNRLNVDLNATTLELISACYATRQQTYIGYF